jgi:hypothetical protein
MYKDSQMNDPKLKFSTDVAPMFDRTVLDAMQRHIDPVKWDRIVELYERKQYKDVILGILYYVDEELAGKTGNENHTAFMIPHGSAVVNINIRDGGFYVDAPFLTVPTSHNVPLLRQVTQLNLYPLNLSTIVLENDRLIFKYDCPLEMCEPHKIYSVLREICAYADAYDDEFINKFNAKRVHEPSTKAIPKETVELAWKKVQAYLKEAAAYVEYFEKKRLTEQCVDLMTLTLMKIDYYIMPQGMLRTDIEKVVSQMQDQESPVMDKFRKGLERIIHLQNYDPGDFAKGMYEAEIFIPLKLNFTNEMIEGYFQLFQEAAQKEMAARDYTGVVLTLQMAFLNLFYHYIFPDDIREIITGALVEASGKPWEKASRILWDALENIMNREKPRRKKGGLWNLLFKSKAGKK